MTTPTDTAAFNAGVRAVLALQRYGLDFCDRMEPEADGCWLHVDAVEALLRPETPALEPVAWLCEADDPRDTCIHREKHFADYKMQHARWRVTPLYTHPAPVCTATGPMSACPNRADYSGT